MFTKNETDILIDALEIWEKDGFTNIMMGAMLTSALGGEKGKTEEYMDKETEKYEEKKRSRRNIAITLKAKLVELQDKAEVKELTDSVLG